MLTSIASYNKIDMSSKFNLQMVVTHEIIHTNSKDDTRQGIIVDILRKKIKMKRIVNIKIHSTFFLNQGIKDINRLI